MHPTAFHPIIVQSLCIRAPGQNVIEMADGTVYDFRDDGTGRQVALVADEGHATRLLSITEGYRFAGAAMIAVESGLDPFPAGQGIIQTTQAEKVDQTGATDPQKTDAPVALPNEAALEAMELSDLRKQFANETGKNASPKHKADVLIAQILAVRELNAQS